MISKAQFNSKNMLHYHSLTGGHQLAVKYITDLAWMVRNLSTASLSLNEMTDIHRRGWDVETALERGMCCCGNVPMRRNNGKRWRGICTMIMGTRFLSSLWMLRGGGASVCRTGDTRRYLAPMTWLTVRLGTDSTLNSILVNATLLVTTNFPPLRLANREEFLSKAAVSLDGAQLPSTSVRAEGNRCAIIITFTCHDRWWLMMVEEDGRGASLRWEVTASEQWSE